MAAVLKTPAVNSHDALRRVSLKTLPAALDLQQRKRKQRRDSGSDGGGQKRNVNQFQTCFAQDRRNPECDCADQRVDHIELAPLALGWLGHRQNDDAADHQQRADDVLQHPGFGEKDHGEDRSEDRR